MRVNKIDLLKVFTGLEKKHYSIIKLPNLFPSYEIGSDLDIFCFDVEDITKIILKVLNQEIDDGFHILFMKSGDNMKIDIMDGDIIHLRFDLYNKLPRYKNVIIKEGLFSSIIENSIIKKVDGLKIKIPSDLDETLLRYIEYNEWFAERPDKIKHINYIENKIKTKSVDLNVFLDKLHFYIDFPKNLEENSVSKSKSLTKLNYLIELIIKTINTIQNKGFTFTIKKISTFFKN